jgi:hypothetical protein
VEDRQSRESIGRLTLALSLRSRMSGGVWAVGAWKLAHWKLAHWKDPGPARWSSYPSFVVESHLGAQISTQILLFTLNETNVLSTSFHVGRRLGCLGFLGSLPAEWRGIWTLSFGFDRLVQTWWQQLLLFEAGTTLTAA